MAKATKKSAGKKATAEKKSGAGEAASAPKKSVARKKSAAGKKSVTGKKVPYVVGARREGDPPSLVACSDKLRERLGWSPRYADLRTIVEHAWKFASRAK